MSMNTCAVHVVHNLADYYLTNVQYYVLAVLLMLNINYETPLIYILMLAISLEITTFGNKWKVFHKHDPEDFETDMINKITYWLMVILFVLANLGQIVISAYFVYDINNKYITVISWFIIARSILVLFSYGILLFIPKMIPDFNKISRVHRR